MKEIIITSSALIVYVMLIRHFFKGKISSRLQYALWFLVAVRLMIPVSAQVYLSLGGIDEFRVMDLVESLEEKFGDITGRLEEPVSFTVNMDSLLGRRAAEYILAEEMPELNAADGATSIFLAGRTGFIWLDLLRGIWYGGMGIMAVWMIAVNIRFGHKLHKERREFLLPEEAEAGLNRRLSGVFSNNPADEEKCGEILAADSLSGHIKSRRVRRACRVRLYTAEHLASPCLYGLPGREAIYLPESIVEDESRLRHVLTHEMCHKRHGDGVWSLLRSVLLIFYWFHPLVWVAAVLSKRDCELACDESALILLGEQERIDYGKTLLSIITGRGRLSDFACTATTMTGTGRNMKERIRRIAEKPKVLGAAVAAVLLLATAASVLVFTESPQFSGRTWEEGTIYVMTGDKRIMLPDTIAGISGYADVEGSRNDLVVYQVASGQEAGRFCTVTYEEAVEFVDAGRMVVPLGSYGQNARLKEYMGIADPVHTYTASAQGEKAPFAFDGKTEWAADGSNQSKKKPFVFDGQSEWASEEVPEEIAEAAGGVPGTDSNMDGSTYVMEEPEGEELDRTYEEVPEEIAEAAESDQILLPDEDINTTVYLPAEEITQMQVLPEPYMNDCYLYVSADYSRVKDKYLEEMEYINSELMTAAGQAIVIGINREITEETFESLAEYKTSYLGDNTKVIALVTALPEPDGASYHGVELTTGAEIQALQINYRPTSEDLAYVDHDVVFFDAVMLFATIENLDECIFRIENEEGASADISWNRAELTERMEEENLWKDLEGEELQNWLKELHDRVVINLYRNE